MMRINFLVPPLKKNKFTGGIQCIFEYARGLSLRGHDVRIIPALPSPAPAWFPCDSFGVESLSKRQLIGKAVDAIKSTVVKFVQHGPRHAEFIKSLRALTDAIALIEPRLLSYTLRKGLILSYVRSAIADADVTIATSFETAIPCALFGKGKLFYFAQHYEPYFKEEMPDPYLAEIEAVASYQLGINIIANSTWLKNTIRNRFPGAEVRLCLNAINHDVYYPAPRKKLNNNLDIRIISYGGRNAKWKGFREMAESMRIAREALPEVNIRWLVYGDACLPSNNSVAPYESLGFLQPPELAKAYQGADILLSASHYESFPLFPLEAMACGLAVVATQAGTEDYAISGVTAEIVPPRSPDKIAKSLIRLISDQDYRERLATNGPPAAREFNWDKSVSTMEKILLE